MPLLSEFHASLRLRSAGIKQSLRTLKVTGSLVPINNRFGTYYDEREVSALIRRLVR